MKGAVREGSITRLSKSAQLAWLGCMADGVAVDAYLKDAVVTAEGFLRVVPLVICCIFEQNEVWAGILRDAVVHPR